MIIRNYCTRKRKNLIKYIKKNTAILRKKLPAGFNINIYDSGIEDAGHNTAIDLDKNFIDINLLELYTYFRNPSLLSRTQPKFKTFKEMVIYALYHEIGHYKLKKYYYNDLWNSYRRECYEDKADKFSRLYMSKKGISYEY